MKQQSPRSRFTVNAAKSQRGQGMTEYIIIVALVAVAAIGAYSFFGKTVRNQMASVSNSLAGESAAATSATAAAATAATAASTEGTNNYTLTNFSTAQTAAE